MTASAAGGPGNGADDERWSGTVVSDGSVPAVVGDGAPRGGGWSETVASGGSAPSGASRDDEVPGKGEVPGEGEVPDQGEVQGEVPRVGCVVLTTGERPVELAAALASVRRQRDVAVRIVVVLNAEPDVARPEVGDAQLLTPGRNLGIPAGRNLGTEALAEGTTPQVVLFLDDDGVLVDDDTLVRAASAFAADPTLGVITMRIIDPVTGLTERRHIPRLRVGDPNRSSWVTTFLGGACIIRLDAYRAAGGLPAEFVYAHEETSLAWRLLDRGYRIRYDASMFMAHPALPPARHAVYHHLTARNRVLLARRHLPAVLGIVYVLVWAVLGAVRAPEGRRAARRGFVDGLRMRGVARDPIRWRTVWRMTRYGRPPLL